MESATDHCSLIWDESKAAIVSLLTKTDFLRMLHHHGVYGTSSNRRVVEPGTSVDPTPIVESTAAVSDSAVHLNRLDWWLEVKHRGVDDFGDGHDCHSTAGGSSGRNLITATCDTS